MGAKRFGYARVSTTEQHLDRQISSLKEHGIDEADIFTDKISGDKQRPKLEDLQRVLRSGDTVVVDSLNRLSRSSKDLLGLLEDWQARGICFVSLKEQIDFNSITGRLILSLLAGLAQFEKEMIRNRVIEGIAAARTRGRFGGRPRTKPDKVAKALRLYEAKTHSVREVCELTGISQSVLYRELRKVRQMPVTSERVAEKMGS